MMEFKDLLAKSIPETKSEPDNERPDWVSEDNASFTAWKAINTIKNEKFAYISKHKTATAFRTTSKFQVQKSEVAKIVGASTQALFYTSSYSEDLLEYLEGKEDQQGLRKGGINGELMKRKADRLAKPRTGLAAQSRPEINATAKSALDRIDELEKQNAAEQLALAIEKLPLNVRDKLKLT